MRNKGFTIIELLVALAMVAIIASIAAPAIYRRYIIPRQQKPVLEKMNRGELINQEE